MIQLLFTLVLAEMALILILLFRSPLRKILIMVLDRVKQGRGPIMASSVAGTLSVVFISTLYSIVKIQKRSSDGIVVNPTDQILLANHLLEASLMGFSLFLAVMIDRLHYYVKELGMLRRSLEMVTKHSGTDKTPALSNEEKQMESKFDTKVKF
ncbi:hypothetical protein LguiA_035636 [Lonicera macranthoides]